MSSSLDQGLTYHDAGNLDRAEECYLQALEEDASNPEAHKLLALVAMEKGNPEDAVTYIEAALALSPHAAQYHHLLGRIRAMQGRLEEAVEALRTAASLAGAERVAIQCDLGLCLEQLQAWEDAQAVYTQVLAVEPANSTALHGMAGSAAALGDLDRAKATYEEILRRTPDDAAAASGLTQVVGWLQDKTLP